MSRYYMGESWARIGTESSQLYNNSSVIMQGALIDEDLQLSSVGLFILILSMFKSLFTFMHLLAISETMPGFLDRIPFTTKLWINVVVTCG